MSTHASATLDALLARETARSTLATLATMDLPVQPSTAPATTAADQANEEALVSTHYSAVPETDFTVSDTEEIGSGGYATVFGVSVRDGAEKLRKGTAYAFKRFPSTTLVQSAVRRLQREVAIGLSLSACPSIHQTVGGCVKKACNGILMHRADESLRDVALHFADLERNGKLTEDQRCVYYVFVARAALCVVAALEHMHQANMVHCDVKPANIFVTKDSGNSAFPRVTLGDFGSVQLVKDAKKLQDVAVLSGTPFYMAPESISVPKAIETTLAATLNSQVLRLRPKVSRASDVWALGVSLLEMANFGENPFVSEFGSYDKYVARLLPAITSATAANTGTATVGSTVSAAAFNFTLPSTCPAALILLAQKCLVLDVTERYSLSQVRTHLEQFLRDASASANVAPATEYTVNIAAARSLASSVTSSLVPLATLIEYMEQQRRTASAMLERHAHNLRLDAAEANSLSQPADEEAEAERAYRRRLVEDIVPRKSVGHLLEASEKLKETHNGRPLYCGPRGGKFWVNESGEPRYLPKPSSAATAAASLPHTQVEVLPFRQAVPQTQQPTVEPNIGGIATGSVYQSSGSANGRPLFQGARGGQYYENAGGNRTYVSAAAPSAPASQAPTNTFGGNATGSVYQSSGSANGRPLFQGARGGQYYENASGNRAYVSAAAPSAPASQAPTNTFGGNATGSVYQSSGSANGSAIFQGPRGGQYYFNSNGNKSYI